MFSSSLPVSLSPFHHPRARLLPSHPCPPPLFRQPPFKLLVLPTRLAVISCPLRALPAAANKLKLFRFLVHQLPGMVLRKKHVISDPGVRASEQVNMLVMVHNGAFWTANLPLSCSSLCLRSTKSDSSAMKLRRQARSASGTNQVATGAPNHHAR
jgi:hypothetical protein